MSTERFELSMLGGPVEAAYRKLRPDLDRVPWDHAGDAALSDPARARARRAFTAGAYLEHRAAAAGASTVRALLDCHAPLDLVALATRFPLDELAHAEGCARMASALGGAVGLICPPLEIAVEAPQGHIPLVRAAILVVRWFCVAEAFSLPFVRAQRDLATHPAARGLYELICLDDALHARFGWMFLDWALEERPEIRDHLPLLGAVAAEATTAAVSDLDPALVADPEPELSAEVAPLGLLSPLTSIALARRSLYPAVLAPLAERGVECPRPLGF